MPIAGKIKWRNEIKISNHENTLRTHHSQLYTRIYGFITLPKAIGRLIKS